MWLTWRKSWHFSQITDFYNHSRTHASLDGKTPAEICGNSVAQPTPPNSYTWEKHCGGLFQLPVAA
jgi:hypothetical protein